MAGAPELILAFDYGERRIGVACGNTLTLSARPLTAITRSSQIPWDQIATLVKEFSPAKFVVGLPYNMDGTDTALSQTIREFAAALSTRYARPAVLVDERLSSRAASEELRDARASGSKRHRVSRADIDMTAAKVLLEQWLRQQELPQQ
ncbi:MAG: Holliday junction resolvase RuvX [Candidatus Obscuribacterales bacterium]|nr:Holliday junction resolvase RuvX [Steroidobacteraceae bacterium]